MNPETAKSLYHAALCCQSLPHLARKEETGEWVEITTVTIGRRCNSFDLLRSTCRHTSCEDEPMLALKEYFRDTVQADDMESMLPITNAGVFAIEKLKQWGLENGIDPKTGEPKVWYLGYSYKDPRGDVHATAGQLASANRICNRYRKEPVRMWLEVQLDRDSNTMVPGTLFMDFGNILIGIEPDGYAHS